MITSQTLQIITTWSIAPRKITPGQLPPRIITPRTVLIYNYPYDILGYFNFLQPKVLTLLNYSHKILKKITKFQENVKTVSSPKYARVRMRR